MSSWSVVSVLLCESLLLVVLSLVLSVMRVSPVVSILLAWWISVSLSIIRVLVMDGDGSVLTSLLHRLVIQQSLLVLS